MEELTPIRPPIDDKGGNIFLAGGCRYVSGEGVRPDAVAVAELVSQIGHVGLTALILRGNPRLN